MRSMLFILAAMCLLRGGNLAAAEPPEVNWDGTLNWSDKYPKAYVGEAGAKGGIEVLGKYDVPKGWEAKDVQFDYYPKGGGTLKTVKTVKLVSGEWGVFDEKAKRVVPDKIPLEKGVWSVRIVVWYGSSDKAGKRVEVVTSWENIEVK